MIKQTTQDAADRILSDTEKALVGAFMSNPVTFQAVKKVLLAAVYYNGTLKADLPADPDRNAALALAMAVGNGQAARSNEELGEDIRAVAEAVRMIELGFNKLEKFKPLAGEVPAEEVNVAR